MSSRSLNKVMLLGHLTRDPIVKYTSSGTPVATFGIATNRSWTTAEGQTKEDVQYHNVVAWSKLAELVGKLLTKGKRTYVEGRLTTRKFIDKTNVERSITEVVMDDFILCGEAKRADAETEDSAQAKPTPSDEFVLPSETSSASTPSPSPSQQVNPDDIPF